ncbi:MAG: glutathione S-transferase family protein [Pseudomonadota bacterium]
MSNTMDESRYTIHGAPMSLFTRKLEAAFDFYGVAYQQARKGTRDDSDLERRAGSHQIPVLTTPENWAVADTTPIMNFMDQRFPARRMFPLGLAGLMVHVVEEILDEWVSRVMVHYRWHYPENTRDVLARGFGVELSLEEAMQHPVAQWGPRACRATGTELPEHQQAAEREYIALLEALEQQLAETAFALGERPCAVDCMLMGGLRAHTNRDPIPDLSVFERTLAWDTQASSGWQGGGAALAVAEITGFGRHVLALGRDHYAPFLLGNAAALAAGQKAFVVDTYGVPCSYLTRPYPERSRQMICDRIRYQLNDAEREAAQGWLDDHGLLECFWPAGVVIQQG